MRGEGGKECAVLTEGFTQLRLGGSAAGDTGAAAELSHTGMGGTEEFKDFIWHNSLKCLRLPAAA